MNAISSSGFIPNLFSSLGSGKQSSGKTSSTTETTAPQSADAKFVVARERIQAARIARGVKEGKITTDQANSLLQQESAVNQEIQADLKAGSGTLTQQQRTQIFAEQNAISASIYAAKNAIPPPPTVSVQG